jgi:hypothetical protein
MKIIYGHGGIKPLKKIMRRYLGTVPTVVAFEADATHFHIQMKDNIEKKDWWGVMIGLGELAKSYCDPNWDGISGMIMLGSQQ